MASPYQQQALRRKLIYIGLIVALFTVSGVFRAYVVEARAEDLSLREQNLGEVELGSSALQLSLTGSRGFVVSALWYWAMDAQKKNRWNELDLYTESLTRLEPHFIVPWLFQSWNLSYNVSVEADQVRDKYFYVARGVQLLGKGERKNRFHPDMRFNMGFYQQHKVMQSDETNVFRCLYQMSCIPYPQRDPERLMPLDANGRRVLDVPAFEKFCADHPQFVRRLHDRLRCGKPEEVVRFLDENKRIPSLFVDDPGEAGPEWAQGRYPLKPLADRFPAMPPPPAVREREAPPELGLYNDDRDELSYDSAWDEPPSRDHALNDSLDAYAGARAWYAYAQECLPAPHPTIPGESAPITDRNRQRKPKMTTNLFRNHPPRAQSYRSDRLEDEGWFDDKGWLITGWFDKDQFHDGSPARVGTGKNWGEDSWLKAHQMWELRGKRSLMLLEPQALADKQAKAAAYLKPRGYTVGRHPGPEPAADSPEHEGWEAARFMFEYTYANNLSNFKHFYYNSLVEMEPERNGQSLIEARKTLFEARQNVRQGRRDRAAELFESKTGLERLRLILERYREFRDDENNQEDFYEFELRYIKLMQDKEGGTYKQLMSAGSLLGAGVQAGGVAFGPGLIDLILTDPERMSKLPVPEFVPEERMRIDVPDKEGKPFVRPETVRIVKTRHGMLKEGPPQPPPGMVPPSLQRPPTPVSEAPPK
jgi:hypothetical protein